MFPSWMSLLVSSYPPAYGLFASYAGLGPPANGGTAAGIGPPKGTFLFCLLFAKKVFAPNATPMSITIAISRGT